MWVQVEAEGGYPKILPEVQEVPVVPLMRDDPMYGVWSRMIGRCEDRNDKRWLDYGGRGIKVCRLWRHSFSEFLKYMGPRPRGLQLDRINNDGNYEPGNCRWATRKQQCNNRRSSHILRFDGVEMTVAQWAEAKGMKYTTLHQRITVYGWSVKLALTTPTGGSRNGQNEEAS